MKVAVSASGKDLNAQIDPRFGRCAYFIIVDTEDMSFEVFDNESMALGGGAGIQAAQFVASRGAGAVLTGNCGPNAVRTLTAAGVELIVGRSGSVGDAVESFKKGELNSTTEPNVGDHHGMGETPTVTSNSPQSGRSSMGVGPTAVCGRSRGRGMGMGRRMGFSAGTNPIPLGSETNSRDEELRTLKDQAKEMRRQIETIESRIRNLERE
jgi:predicted Fe-Mo cluster-binding NifX family protein